MSDLRRRSLGTAVWIPLRSSHADAASVKYGYLGYKEEFFGAGSLAVYLPKREEANALGWQDLGLMRTHSSHVDDGRYVPSDAYRAEDKSVLGVPLVLDQPGNSEEPSVWHLHQDVAIALELKREGDVWVATNEGYEPVARIERSEDGRPTKLEIRKEYLRDYLCARQMALRVVTYHRRSTIEESASHIGWENGGDEVQSDGLNWQGYVRPIHEGGYPYGSQTGVFHAGREDVDYDEDVPELSLPTDDTPVKTKSWTVSPKGRKLFAIQGELWREEWVEPGAQSPRVRRDSVPSQVTFVTDASGTRANSDAIKSGGSWLWFEPSVIPALLSKRGSGLSWHTRDTGSVGASPDSSVHFGINKLGLITVFAKDVATLAEWEKRLWAGHNRGPEGGVSSELLDSQAKAIPADTQAPEPFLTRSIEQVNEVALKATGVRVFREHKSFEEIAGNAHRFRSLDKNGLLGLAKDLARLTADLIDASAIRSSPAFPETKEKLGSLKTLERLLAGQIDKEKARSLMGPLFGMYDLRHADAHLPSENWDASMTLVGVDHAAPFVVQGFQLLDSCVACLTGIAVVIQGVTKKP